MVLNIISESDQITIGGVMNKKIAEQEKKTLQPDETVQKILLSTTSRMTGEYIGKDVLITHAWPDFGSSSANMRWEETPVSRSMYILAFKTEPFEKKVGSPLPIYSPTGDVVASYLSVLFGKRFDCHGMTEGSGFFQVPDFSAFNALCRPALVFNSHKPRECRPVTLQLNCISSIRKLLDGDYDLDTSLITKLEAACKFYMQALQNAEHNPEVAYLHLITSGEILSGAFKYSPEEVLSAQTREDLNKIEHEVTSDTKVANRIKSQLLSAKKRFVKSICSLLDDEFYKVTESEVKYGFFKPDDIERRIGAAYDLRSRYVHSGVPFGRWIEPSRQGGDVQFGLPVVEDKEFAKTLALAPTFKGLERCLRYCILRYMSKQGLFDPELAQIDT